MPSIRFAPAPEVTEFARIPSSLSSRLYYSRSELDEFREAERERCGKIMTKSLQSRILGRRRRKNNSKASSSSSSSSSSNKANKVVIQDANALKDLWIAAKTTEALSSRGNKRGFLGSKGRAETRRARLIKILENV